MASWTDRYVQGRCREVWEEVGALGAELDDPVVRGEVAELADLTMRRAAANVATIVVRLTAMGYRFGSRFDHNRRRRTIEELGLRDGMAQAGRDVGWVDRGDVVETVMGWPGPRSGVDDLIAEAESLIGPLPAALAALARRVDRVDLSGSFPGWDPSAYEFDEDPEWPDFGTTSAPFNLVGLDIVAEHRRPGTTTVDDSMRDAAGGFAVPIGADHDLAANVPGGYITVAVPGAGPDPAVSGVLGAEGIGLVDYLRLVFAYGGFPGFALAATVPSEIETLRAGLLPI